MARNGAQLNEAEENVNERLQYLPKVLGHFAYF